MMEDLRDHHLLVACRVHSVPWEVHVPSCPAQEEEGGCPVRQDCSVQMQEEVGDPILVHHQDVVVVVVGVEHHDQEAFLDRLLRLHQGQEVACIQEYGCGKYEQVYDMKKNVKEVNQ